MVCVYCCARLGYGGLHDGDTGVVNVYDPIVCVRYCTKVSMTSWPRVCMFPSRSFIMPISLASQRLRRFGTWNSIGSLPSILSFLSTSSIRFSSRVAWRHTIFVSYLFKITNFSASGISLRRTSYMHWYRWFSSSYDLRSVRIRLIVGAAGVAF